MLSVVKIECLVVSDGEVVDPALFVVADETGGFSVVDNMLIVVLGCDEAVVPSDEVICVLSVVKMEGLVVFDEMMVVPANLVDDDTGRCIVVDISLIVVWAFEEGIIVVSRAVHVPQHPSISKLIS